MKRNKLAIFALVLWVLTIAGIAFMMINGRVTPMEDNRLAIPLSKAERDFITKEMRTFVTNLMLINEALSRGDNETVAKIAVKNGQQEVEMVPPQILIKLPMEFKQLGFGVHEKYDVLVKMAEEGASVSEQLKQVSEIMTGCVSCHATYRIQLTD